MAIDSDVTRLLSSTIGRRKRFSIFSLMPRILALRHGFTIRGDRVVLL